MQLKFELAYYDVTVQHVSHDAAETPFLKWLNKTVMKWTLQTKINKTFIQPNCTLVVGIF